MPDMDTRPETDPLMETPYRPSLTSPTPAAPSPPLSPSQAPEAPIVTEPGALPPAVEIFRGAIERSSALHAQALQDMQQRSVDMHAQLSSLTQQRIDSLSLPQFAYVQRAMQLNEEFWPGVVASAEQILREHGELPAAESAG